MKHGFYAIATTALLALSTAALAQAPAAPAPFDTAAPAAPADPARLAAARMTVDAVFPAGTYAKIMDAAMNGVMDKMMGSMEQMPLRDLAGMSGASPEDLAKLPKATLNDIIAIRDPAFQQRLDATMKVMMPALTHMLTQFEPGMREGLAHAYARRFTADQLADMNRFFATPSGSAYAANAMLIQVDPEVMKPMVEAMPKAMQGFMQQMPDLMKQVEAATADLPKPRTYQQLTPAQRGRLAQLLGVTEAQLAKNAATATK